MRYVHDAPAELVFACLTTPEHLTHFWGPDGTHTPLPNIVVDLWPGGAFETTMVNDRSGETYTMRAVYVAVDPPRFLSWREAGSGVLTEITFTDRGDGTTEVVTVQQGLPPHMLTPEARAGWRSALDRAAAHVAVQALAGPQFQALAEALAGQSPTAPSLCEGWEVRHVVAHMTMAARYDGPAFMAELASVGYDFDALSEKVARRDGELPFATLLADLRGDTMARWAPPGGGAAGALSHVVIHGLDITAALGLPRTASDEATRLVLDGLADGKHFGVDTTGQRLRATDLDWERGDGVLVEAPAGDLVLRLSGRTRQR
ncbi:maleylpyruvate isomerase family mycothiol-dependent enzyme [Actinoplanes sp. NPDC000266]